LTWVAALKPVYAPLLLPLTAGALEAVLPKAETTTTKSPAEGDDAMPPVSVPDRETV
jgi:hypothetical protein